MIQEPLLNQTQAGNYPVFASQEVDLAADENLSISSVG
jgi:hypothetical protein